MERKDKYGNILEKGIYYEKKRDRYNYRYTDEYFRARNISAKTLDELKCKIDNLYNDYEISISLDTNPTLNQCFDECMKLRRDIKDKTKVQMINTYNRYIHDTIGKKYIKDISQEELVMFYGSLIDKGMKVSYVEYCHCILSILFKRAVKSDYISKDVSYGAFYSNFSDKAHEEEIKRSKTLTKEETDKLFEEVKLIGSNMDKNFITVLFGTGMRVGEISALTWDDIDFDKRTISISKQLKRVWSKNKEYIDESSKGVHIDTPKSVNSIRSIPMIDEVYDALRDEYRIQKFLGLYCEKEIDGYSGFIFFSKNLNVLNGFNIDRILNRYVDSYNLRQDELFVKDGKVPKYIKRITPHMARHTFCTRMCEESPDIKLTQSVMGHANVYTTLDTYTYVEKKRIGERIPKDFKIM